MRWDCALMVPRLISVGRGDEKSGCMGKVSAPLVVCLRAWVGWEQGGIDGHRCRVVQFLTRWSREPTGMYTSHVCTVVVIDGSLPLERRERIGLPPKRSLCYTTKPRIYVLVGSMLEADWLIV